MSSFDTFNTFCQKNKLQVKWEFLTEGNAHECSHIATLHVGSYAPVKGEPRETRTSAKSSAISLFMEEEGENLVLHSPPNSPSRGGKSGVLLFADVDSSLDLMSLYLKRNTVSTVHAFCGRYFRCKCLPPPTNLHRCVTGVKNAAEMSLSFHAGEIMRREVERGECKKVVVVSRDASLQELCEQMTLAYPSLKIENVTNHDDIPPQSL